MSVPVTLVVNTHGIHFELLKSLAAKLKLDYLMNVSGRENSLNIPLSQLNIALRRTSVQTTYIRDIYRNTIKTN